MDGGIFKEDLTMDKIEMYDLIWDEIKHLGFDKDDAISYFDFVECCENANIDEKYIDVEDFSEHYGIYIG